MISIQCSGCGTSLTVRIHPDDLPEEGGSQNIVLKADPCPHMLPLQLIAMAARDWLEADDTCEGYGLGPENDCPHGKYAVRDRLVKLLEAAKLESK